MSVRKLYCRLSPEGRMQFWTIASSCLVTAITFWMGITVQYLVYNRVSEESGKLTHIQLVDKILPLYDELLYSNTVFPDLVRLTYVDDNLEVEKSLTDLIDRKKRKIVEAGKRSVEITGKMKYYFSRKHFDEVSFNNGKIMIGVKMLQLLERPGYTAEQKKDSLLYYITSHDFIQKAGPNSKGKDLASSGAEMLNSSGNIQKDIYQNFVLVPMIKNLHCMTKEIEAYKPFTQRKAVFIVILILISSLVVCYVICRIIFRLVFRKDGNLSVSSSYELKCMRMKLDRQNREMSNMDAALYAKDKEIDELRGKLKSKEWETESLLKKLKRQTELEKGGDTDNQS